ncbi:MAG: RNA-binding protein [Pseudomonadota bacterium]|nr:MAG: RNA-binding protein [Pseudomonadota bacterium]
MTGTKERLDVIRLDKWLWAARFFKTRALAAEAVAGGKVRLDGERTKPAKTIRVGDALTVRIGPFEHDIRVLALSTRRGPASQAALLYQESVTSQAARKELAARLAVERRCVMHSAGRPNKKERRLAILHKKTRVE